MSLPSAPRSSEEPHEPRYHQALHETLDYLDRAEGSGNAKAIFIPVIASKTPDGRTSSAISKLYNEFTDSYRPKPKYNTAAQAASSRNFAFSTAFTLLSETHAHVKHRGPSISSSSTAGSWDGYHRRDANGDYKRGGEMYPDGTGDDGDDDFYTLIRLLCDVQRANGTIEQKEGTQGKQGRKIHLSVPAVAAMGHFVGAGGSSYVFGGTMPSNSDANDSTKLKSEVKDATTLGGFKKPFSQKGFVTKRMMRTGFMVDASTDSNVSSPNAYAATTSHDATNTTKDYLSELLLESRILTHPPIANLGSHFVEMQSFRWDAGPNAPPMVPRKSSGEDSQWGTMWPGLNIESADLGSLQHFLSDSNVAHSNMELKMNMVFDIAAGLDFLHECGIVHGDVKTENVLVFQTESGYCAKLTDFGCSLVFEKEGKLPEWRGFTYLWAAPEFGRREVLEEGGLERVLLTDNYSFGWLVVRTAVFDGANPFDWLNLDEGGSLFAAFDSIDSVKMGTEEFKCSGSMVKEVVRIVKVKLGDEGCYLEDICNIVERTLNPDPNLRTAALLGLFPEERFQRKLSEWKDIQISNSWPPRPVAPFGEIDILVLNQPITAVKYVHRGLEFPTRQQVFCHLELKARQFGYLSKIRSAEQLENKGHIFYQLFLSHLNAFGTEYDVDRALDCLAESIDCGYQKAVALGKNAFLALKREYRQEDEEEEDETSHAVVDIPPLNSEQEESLQSLLSTLIQLSKNTDNWDELRHLADEWTLNHSPDGSPIMHWIVRRFQEVEGEDVFTLIDALGMDINIPNQTQNESLFLASIKYGNANAMAEMLNYLTPNFTIPDNLGRTCLHYLCSMDHLDGQNISDLAMAFVKGGCDILARDNSGVSAVDFAVINEMFDVVHALLSTNREMPSKYIEKAIDLAVGSYTGYILKILFENLPSPLPWQTVCGYLRKACTAADPLINIKRHGESYIPRLRFTFFELEKYLADYCSDSEHVRAQVRHRKYYILLSMTTHFNVGVEVVKWAIKICFRDLDEDDLMTRVWASMKIDPIHWAILRGNSQVVKLLLENNVGHDGGYIPEDVRPKISSEVPEAENDLPVNLQGEEFEEGWLDRISLARLAVIHGAGDANLLKYLLQKAEEVEARRETYSSWPLFYSKSMDGPGCRDPHTGIFDLFQVAVMTGNYEIATIVHEFEERIQHMKPRQSSSHGHGEVSNHAEFVLSLVTRVPDTCLNLTPLNYLLTIIPPEEFAAKFQVTAATTILHSLALQQPRNQKYAAAITRMHTYLVHRLPQLVNASEVFENGVPRPWSPPLGMAVLYRNPTYLHVLLVVGNADPNRVNAGRMTPLDMLLMIRLADSPLPGTREALKSVPVVWDLVEEFTRETLAKRYLESATAAMVMAGETDKEARLRELGEMWRVERMYEMLIGAGGRSVYWKEWMGVEVPEVEEGVNGLERWDRTVREWVEMMVRAERAEGGAGE
ncbi:hypothetical protein DFH27DRAFT_612052 [Peziza echinospora]|nr:hypothetical protein DFH27DRAFT_612052 [Peziza echinospora]